MVGFSRFYLNEARQARADGDDAARAAALVGQPRAEMLGEFMGAFACHELGEFESMKGYLERALRLARQLNARRFEAQALEKHARILLHEDRRADAVDQLREALSICREFRNPILRADCDERFEPGGGRPSRKRSVACRRGTNAGSRRCRAQPFLVSSRRYRSPAGGRGRRWRHASCRLARGLRARRALAVVLSFRLTRSMSRERFARRYRRPLARPAEAHSRRTRERGFKPFVGAVDAVLTA